MIFAVDFDDPLKINGKPNLKLISFLRNRQAIGDAVVLFTSRTGASLNEAVGFCLKHGLALNGVQGGKVRADVYIDDKAEKPMK